MRDMWRRGSGLALVVVCLVWGTGGLLAAPAEAQAPGPVTVRGVQNSRLGLILTDGQGRTLYRFTNDTGAVSVCYDQCAQTWPPLVVAGGQATLVGIGGTLGTSMRQDGTRQVTYNGVSLYYFARDAAPGDTNGEGVGGVWFTVRAVAVVGLPRTGGGPAPAIWLVALAGAAALAAGYGLRRARR